MIARVERVTEDKFEPYVGVVYHLDNDVKEVTEVELLENENSNPSTTRPYIRTSKSIPERQDKLSSNHKRPQYACDILFEESDGAFSSTPSSSATNKSKTATTHLAYQALKKTMMEMMKFFSL